MDKVVKPRLFSIQVTAEGQPVSKTFSLDKNVKLVLGVQLTSNDPKLLFYRGSQRIEISGDEIYPEDFESKCLMSGLSTEPNKRYDLFGNAVIPGNGEIKVLYKDSPNPNAPFVAYKVTFNFLCELK